MGIDGVNSGGQPVVREFNTLYDFISQFDLDKTGLLDKSEIEAAKKYFNDAGVTSVYIDEVEYNLVTDEDMNNNGKLKGSGKNDLILSTEASEIKGKGGDDIIFASDAEKIKGNNGADFIFLTGSNATILGGLGKDKINVDGNSNLIKGQWGWDDISVNGDNNNIKGNAGGDDFYVKGDNNKINVGDWANRSAFGKIATFLPKALLSGVLTIPDVVTKMISPEGNLSKKIDQLYKQIWGDFSNNVFVKGENNTVQTYFNGDVNVQEPKGVDVLYEEHSEQGQTLKGSFEDFDASPDVETKTRLLDYFRNWLSGKSKKD